METIVTASANNLGALFVVSIGWYFVFFMEMMLLFIPILAFIYGIRKMFNV